MGSLGPDAIARALEKVGVHVRAAWVESCAAHLLAAEPGFGSMPLRRRVDLCYLQFLHADMNSAGSGCLAPGHADGDPARDPGICWAAAASCSATRWRTSRRVSTTGTRTSRRVRSAC